MEGQFVFCSCFSCQYIFVILPFVKKNVTTCLVHEKYEKAHFSSLKCLEIMFDYAIFESTWIEIENEEKKKTPQLRK